MRKKLQEISEDDLNLFNRITVGLQYVPSLFVWNVNEIPVGIAKKQVALDITVAKQAPLGTVTIAEERKDSQMMLVIALSVFGDLVPSMPISKNKTVEAERLAELQLAHGHNYMMRSAVKSLQQQFWILTGGKHSLLRKTINCASKFTAINQLSFCSAGMRATLLRASSPMQIPNK
jgi:hypothetical protein